MGKERRCPSWLCGWVGRAWGQARVQWRADEKAAARRHLPSLLLSLLTHSPFLAEVGAIDVAADASRAVNHDWLVGVGGLHTQQEEWQRRQRGVRGGFRTPVSGGRFHGRPQSSVLTRLQ